MKTNEKRMLTALLVIGGAVVLVKFGLPTVRSVFDYKSQLAARKKELFELENKLSAEKEHLGSAYAEFVHRTGSTDADDVKDDVYEHISTLCRDVRLSGARITPKSPSTDRKTKLTTLSFGVSGKGSFAQCTDFLRAFYASPYIARFDNIKLTPTDSRQNVQHDEVNLSAEIEVLVLPDNKQFEVAAGERPATWPKGKLDDSAYAALRGHKPFTPFSESVAARPAASPTPAPIAAASPPPGIDPAGPPSDPEGGRKVVRGTIKYGVDEVLVEDTTTGLTEYVPTGGTLDGGQVILVHPLGAVVHKADDKEDFGDFVYPLNQPLSGALALADAAAWPEIQAAMMLYERVHAGRERAGGSMGGSGPLLPPAGAWSIDSWMDAPAWLGPVLHENGASDQPAAAPGADVAGGRGTAVPIAAGTHVPSANAASASPAGANGNNRLRTPAPTPTSRISRRPARGKTANPPADAAGIKGQSPGNTGVPQVTPPPRSRKPAENTPPPEAEAEEPIPDE